MRRTESVTWWWNTTHLLPPPITVADHVTFQMNYQRLPLIVACSWISLRISLIFVFPSSGSASDTVSLCKVFPFIHKACRILLPCQWKIVCNDFQISDMRGRTKATNWDGRKLVARIQNCSHKWERQACARLSSTISWKWLISNTYINQQVVQNSCD